MVERRSALWRRGTNFMDFILKGGVFYPNPAVAASWFCSSCARATVLLFNKIQRTAWEVELGPRKLAG